MAKIEGSTIDLGEAVREASQTLLADLKDLDEEQKAIVRYCVTRQAQLGAAALAGGTPDQLAQLITESRAVYATLASLGSEKSSKVKLAVSEAVGAIFERALDVVLDRVIGPAPTPRQA
jgi:hypothetical protein